mgnify:CR=1 FL=1
MQWAGGGGGAAAAPDMTNLPDWSLWAIGAAVLILVVILLGQRRIAKARAAAFRAVEGE